MGLPRHALPVHEVVTFWELPVSDFPSRLASALLTWLLLVMPTE